MTTALQARVERPGALHVREVDLPVPPPGYARLELDNAGICGTDLAIIAGSTPLARYPLTLGHECVGRIIAAPSDSSVAPGDWAIVYPTVSCGACHACWNGRENQCERMRVMGISDPSGCFASALDVPVAQLIPLSEHIATTQGSLIEPLAVACHVVKRAAVAGGDRVLVIGSGVIGLSCAAVARAVGAEDVLLLDRLDRGAATKALGFSSFRHITAPAGWEQIDWPADVVLDCAVTDRTVTAGMGELTRGGRFVAVATPKRRQTMTLCYARAYEHELSMLTARNYARTDFSAAIKLLARGAVDLRPIVTARYPLAHIAEAIAVLSARPQEHLKIQLTA